MSLPALGPRPLAAVTSEHIASPTETAIPLSSLPGRGEPDRSESPGGTADYTLRRESAAAGDRRPPGCGPDGTSPPGRAARASVGERRDPPCPLPGRDKPDRSEDPEGPRIYTLRRESAAAGSPRPGRVCRSAAGGRPITLSQACGERRDPSSPQPGRTSRPVRGLEGTAD